jgi:hypothetical protein
VVFRRTLIGVKSLLTVLQFSPVSPQLVNWDYLLVLSKHRSFPISHPPPLDQEHCFLFVSFDVLEYCPLIEDPLALPSPAKSLLAEIYNREERGTNVA